MLFRSVILTNYYNTLIKFIMHYKYNFAIDLAILINIK